ncbi:MAG: hypothetical protein CMN30_05205 [Sandaracinus sp.]|nr:hypothetical protein [Sandaracinus sp.]
MRLLRLLPACFLLLGACDDAAVDPCAGDPCAVVTGSTCGATDGLCHCGGETGPVCGEGNVCGGDACVTPLPDPVCDPAATPWTAGTPVFREVTAEWGLSGIEGTRLNVTDIDGDGWADLFVRRNSANVDALETGEGARRAWLLRNQAGDGFTDVTIASGILVPRTDLGAGLGRPVSGAAFGDVDNDGDLDAFLALDTSDRTITLDEKSELYLNDGAGVFTLAPPSAVRSPDFISVPAGQSFVDYDLDGNLDLWATENSFITSRLVVLQDRLYRGDGAAGFVDATDAAGLTTEDWESLADLDAGRAHSRAWGALARDLNGDGLPELLAPSYGRAPNHLWQGVRAADGTVTFENRSVESGYAFDGDETWQDNQFAQCFCQGNPDAEGCADVPAPAIVCSVDNWSHDQDRHPFRLGGNSGQTSAGDVDGDGDLDLFTGEIRHWWAGSGADGSELLVNDGTATFTRPGDAALGLEADHLGEAAWDEGHMTNTLFDFDNDGRLDVYVGASDYPGNRGLLYHQDASGELAFTEVATGDFFEHNRSHGVVVADFDRDGDLDIIVGHSRSRCDAGAPNDCYETAQIRAFENVSPPRNWLQVRLEGGAGTNRAAIGAQVTVTTPDGRTQVAEVDGGHGHYGSQSDLTLHFGLGTACEAEVRVRWPNAELTTETATLPAGTRVQWTQGATPEPAD